MIRVHFVADGPRDSATLPHLVSNILGTEIKASTAHWARLNQAGSGYQRKLLFAIRQAEDSEARGLVAVVDRDKATAGSHLGELQAARQSPRAMGESFPTALGEAVPHGEAWLLDDPAAIRAALDLGDEVDIPHVRRTRDPKAVVNGLIEQSRHRRENVLDVFADIARLVDHRRCSFPDDTGFTALVEDVRQELECLLPKH